MLRYGLICLLVAATSMPAFAITELNKVWKTHYVTDTSPENFASAVRKASCQVCHVKGKEKKDVNNEYGEALKDLIDSEEIKKRIKTEPEKVTEEIIAAFKKIEEAKSKDGKTFGEKIKAGELPATDSGL